MKAEIVENVPEWASCYLMYGDESGLTASNKVQILGFLDGLRRDGLLLVAPVEGSRNEFCAHPAFGGGCAVEAWAAEREG